MVQFDVPDAVISQCADWEHVSDLPLGSSSDFIHDHTSVTHGTETEFVFEEKTQVLRGQPSGKLLDEYRSSLGVNLLNKSTRGVIGGFFTRRSRRVVRRRTTWRVVRFSPASALPSLLAHLTVTPLPLSFSLFPELRTACLVFRVAIPRRQ